MAMHIIKYDYIPIELHSIILDQEKSLDKFKAMYDSYSEQEKQVCLESEISNQTLLQRYGGYLVIYMAIGN